MPVSNNGASVSVSGLEALRGKLVAMAGDGAPVAIKVGFFAEETYPDGTSVASVAFGNEFGQVVKVEAHDTTIYRKIDLKTGDFKKGGKFVKKRVSNYETTHHVKAHEINIPPRPFMRHTIEVFDAKQSFIDGYKKTHDHDKSLERVAIDMVESMKQAIDEWTTPGNSAATIAKKGADNPLVDTLTMRDAVSYKIVDGG